MIKKFFAYLDGPKSFLPKWMKVSNRSRHLIYALPAGIIGGPLFVLGLALGMEYKDKLWGGSFDWLDFLATLIGGIPGAILWGVLLF